MLAKGVGCRVNVGFMVRILSSVPEAALMSHAEPANHPGDSNLQGFVVSLTASGFSDKGFFVCRV